LREANTVSPHLSVEELRYRPGYSADVKTRAVFHRRHIQLFTHKVYIHTSSGFVKWLDLTRSEFLDGWRLIFLQKGNPVVTMPCPGSASNG